MSALNVFVSPEKVSLLTDTSVYNGNGEIILFARKALVVSSWTGAVSGRGDVWGIVTVADVAEEFGSFDEFIARSAAIIQRRHAAALVEAVEAGATGQTRIEVTAIGWSESRDRAMAFMLTSEGDEGPSYVWTDVCDDERGCGFSIGPFVTTTLEDWRLHRVGADISGYETADFDAVKHGIPLMESQRRQLSDPKYFPGKPFHAVGGQIWSTVLTREGVEQEMVHDWNDRPGVAIVPAQVDDNVGPKIAPSFMPVEDTDLWFEMRRRGLLDPDTLLPRPDATIAPMPANRAERRRQEKLGRKLARAS